MKNLNSSPSLCANIFSKEEAMSNNHAPTLQAQQQIIDALAHYLQNHSNNTEELAQITGISHDLICVWLSRKEDTIS